jgi:hypothetical protein
VQNKTKDVGRLWGRAAALKTFEPLNLAHCAHSEWQKVTQPFMKQINIHAGHVELLAFDPVRAVLTKYSSCSDQISFQTDRDCLVFFSAPSL